jgi:hypothetical protein
MAAQPSSSRFEPHREARMDRRVTVALVVVIAILLVATVWLAHIALKPKAEAITPIGAIAVPAPR